MDIIPSILNSYLDTLTPDPGEVLREMDAEARQLGFPHVGPQVGALLEVLAKLVDAQLIIELGSGFGYSAAWFARGMAYGGTLILTDRDSANRDKAMEYFRRLDIAEQIDYRVDDALALARGIEGPFDIVFNDIDKKEYPASIELAHGLLRSGGLFITDNSLWRGEVAMQGGGMTVEAIRTFNRNLADHPGFDALFLPIRDGVAVARKR